VVDEFKMQKISRALLISLGLVWIYIIMEFVPIFFIEKH
jgi:preprotein translocase subunit SecY